MVPASFAWRWGSLKYAGTVTTAFVMVPPRYTSAVSFISGESLTKFLQGSRDEDEI
jgi:hypothetical protein